MATAIAEEESSSASPGEEQHEITTSSVGDAIKSLRSASLYNSVFAPSVSEVPEVPPIPNGYYTPDQSPSKPPSPPTTFDALLANSTISADENGRQSMGRTSPTPGLRKKASMRLRLGRLRSSTKSSGKSSRKTDDGSESALSRDTFESVRSWENSSTPTLTSHVQSPASPIASADPSPLATRPRTSHDPTSANALGTSRVRPSISIPDFKSMRPSLASPPKSPTFWRDGGAAQIRESLHSAVTGTSSPADLSSVTGRTISTWTSNSSFSEYSRQSRWSKITEEGLSVEDAIKMYEDGFADDTPDITSPSLSTHQHVPSPLAVNVDDSPIDGGGEHAGISSAQPVGQASSTISSDDRMSSDTKIASPLSASSNRHFRPPSIVARDRYGFKAETQYITINQFDLWNRIYGHDLKRRHQKWVHLMNSLGLHSDQPDVFPLRSKKIKSFIRKGIPPEWRGAAWWFYADGPSRLANNAGLYARLVGRIESGEISPADREHIERDLHRTFPDNYKFKPESKSALPADTSGSPDVETGMIRSLRRVLQAFALDKPQIGYCQSLNFIAGFLLLFLKGDEEKASHMLCIITTEYLPGTHGVALEGANVDIGVLMASLEDLMPSLWDKLDDRADSSASVVSGDMRVSAGLPTISLATTAWFMSCFVSTLPVETCCRVWDLLFYEGSKTLFRVALAIFKLGEREISRTGDSMEVFQVVQSLPRGLIDANLLIATATGKNKRTGGIGTLTQATIDRRREQRRGLYQAESRLPQLGLTEEEKTKLTRSNTKSRLRRFASKKIKHDVE